MIFVLLIGYWCRSSSWRWQPHIRGCRLHYPLSRAEMRFLVQFFSKMYLLYVSIWWKNWKPHFFAIFNPSKTQFSWTLWDHLATFPDLRFQRLEPQIRKSDVHCICPLHCFAGSEVLSRRNLKSGIPDLRFLNNVQWKCSVQCAIKMCNVQSKCAMKYILVNRS